MPVKLDACSLIYLAKAELLDLAEELYDEVWITSEVYREAVIAGKEAGHSDALVIEQHVAAGRVRVRALSPEAQAKLQVTTMPAKLGLGEQETIIEALEEGCLAVLDDFSSRTAAAMLGVSLCGSDTLLVEALLKQLITPADYEDKATRLASVMGMRADDLAELLRLGKLIEEVLRNGGEGGEP